MVVHGIATPGAVDPGSNTNGFEGEVGHLQSMGEGRKWDGFVFREEAFKIFHKIQCLSGTEKQRFRWTEAFAATGHPLVCPHPAP